MEGLKDFPQLAALTDVVRHRQNMTALLSSPGYKDEK